MDYNASQSRQSNSHDIQVNRTQSKMMPSSNSNKNVKRKKPFKALILLMFVLFFVAGSLLLAIIMNGEGKDSLIKSNNYQAVFLDDQNGQVYFGKLKTVNNNYYQLTDIFYIRVENNQAKDTQAAQQNISLAKLGNELHGPEDVMFISKSKVLFWENLKDDGKVVQSIKEYKKNGSTTNTNNGTVNTSDQGGTSNQTTTNGASTNTSAPATETNKNTNNTRR